MRCPKCGTVAHSRGYVQLDVPAMIREYKAGASMRRIAESRGVAYSTVRNRLVEAGQTLRTRKESR